MSSEYAIEVSNLGKCYQVYDKPSDRLKDMLFRGRRQYYKEFWALKNVSFKVKKGETVGIVGRNGSGKSTLLQMICGTLNPTAGEIKVNGRVAALLELGAGFNPEFTGVENVYMAASLYGLTKEETDQRFEAITAFADIGDHISQSVKTYSSGMYIRLAFSVAIHVDPDILVIDEALSVGDIEFQMKCLDRMEEVRSNGVTVLFVSHSLEQVKRFCNEALWLEKGKIRLSGEANFVSDQFRDFSFAKAHNEYSESDPCVKKNSGPAFIKSVSIDKDVISPFDSVTVRIEYIVGEKALPKLLLGVAIKDAKNTFIFGPNTYLEEFEIPTSSGEHVVEYQIPKLPLLTGNYSFDVGLFTDAGLVCLDYLGLAARLSVVAEYFSEGLVYIDHRWKVISDD